MEENRLILREEFESLVVELRGVPVIIDRTLADFYELDTRELNQNVKNNPELFPDDFVFQVSGEEKVYLINNFQHFEKLKFSPHLPLAYTRLGTYMIPTVLKTPIAKKIHVQIIRLFEALLVEKFQQPSLQEELINLKNKVFILNKELEEYKLREEFNAVRFEAIFHKLKEIDQKINPPPANKIGFEIKSSS
jgi:hypothetical protein